MTYTLSISFKKEVKKINEKIEKFKKETLIKRFLSYIKISTIFEDHDYAIKSPTGFGLYITYKSVPNEVKESLIFFIMSLAEKYGEEIVDPENNKKMKYYNYDSKYIIIKEKIEQNEFKEYYLINNKIIDESKLEKLNDEDMDKVIIIGYNKAFRKTSDILDLKYSVLIKELNIFSENKDDFFKTLNFIESLYSGD